MVEQGTHKPLVGSSNLPVAILLEMLIVLLKKLLAQGRHWLRATRRLFLLLELDFFVWQ